MLHEVYRFSTQIQYLCREVFLDVRSLHLQSANLPKFCELPKLWGRNPAAFDGTAVAVRLLGMLEATSEGRPEDE